jgi:sugar/nucleoside kinase (ribokinase family)
MTSCLVVGATTFDLFAARLPRLPAVDRAGDEFTPRSLVHLSDPPLPCIGGNGGNAAFVLARLGRQVRLLTSLGDDLFGRKAEAWLRDAGCAVALLPPRSTSFNFVATDQEGNRYSFFYPVEMDEKQLGAEAARLGLGAQDHLLLAGYPHPTTRALAVLAEVARERGATVSLDIGPALAGFTLDRVASLLPLLHILFCNEDELSLLSPDEEPGEVKRLLTKELDHGLVIKRGSEGAKFVNQHEEIQVPAFAVKTSTTVGAGDAFNAGFLHSWLAGSTQPADQLRYGSAVAALVLAGGQGVGATPTSEAVENFLKSMPPTREEE